MKKWGQARSLELTRNESDPDPMIEPYFISTPLPLIIQGTPN